MTILQWLFGRTGKSLFILFLVALCSIVHAEEQSPDSFNIPIQNLPGQGASSSSVSPQGSQDAYGRYIQQPGANRLQQPLYPSNAGRFPASPNVTESTDRDQWKSIPETNDFQLFIEQSIGKRLPLFGHNLFE